MDPRRQGDRHSARRSTSCSWVSSACAVSTSCSRARRRSPSAPWSSAAASPASRRRSTSPTPAIEVVARRARCHHRRQDGQARQDLPHAGLLGLHPHAAHGRGGPAPQHHPHDLFRGRGGARLRGQLRGRHHAQRRPTSTSTSASAAAICEEKCPRKAPDLFNGGDYKSKAIYIPFPQAVPKVAVLDPSTAPTSRRASARLVREVLCGRRDRLRTAGPRRHRGVRRHRRRHRLRPLRLHQVLPRVRHGPLQERDHRPRSTSA